MIHKVGEAIQKTKAFDIRFPKTPAEWKAASDGFKAISGIELEGAISAIDGILVRVREPAASEVCDPASYKSRKGFFGVNVQAACNADRLFTHLSCLTPGGTNDALAWRMSKLKNWIETNLPKKYFMLGDAAYHNTESMLSPYTNSGNYGEKEDSLNYFQSQCRIAIECAFGELVGRFQVLHRPLRGNLKFKCMIIRSAFKLHNFFKKIELEVIDNHGEITRYWLAGYRNRRLNSQITRRRKRKHRGGKDRVISVVRHDDEPTSWRDCLINNAPDRTMGNPSGPESTLRSTLRDHISNCGHKRPKHSKPTIMC
mmetsp:Transcript_26550/g.42669  ORF Transcript_26550/g.42669 Transcript_26550/m.42669 type:complete len:313 (-) Transcript_26550:47-985(-)